jgi:O-antigen/teichoic acid export membrane protein
MTDSSKPSRAGQLMRSGLLLSAVGLLSGLGNYAFQMIMGRRLSVEEFGLLNTTLGLVGLLGLPLIISSNAITHYIAHFRAQGNQAGLSGLLLGCRRFLLRLTVVGSVAAVVLVKPLAEFFNFPRNSLMLVAVVCVIAGLWGTFGSTLCQGMSWFRRLAFVGMAAVVLRLVFGWFVTLKYPAAEAAALASAVALLANLALLYWRKELVWTGERESPWGWDFARYLMMAVACVGGGYCFTQGDLLVAQRYFQGDALGHYAAAGLLGRALPMVVAPLLTVLFTSRSGHRQGTVVSEQLRLLGLYALGLMLGAAMLIALRGFCIRLLLGAYTPDAAAMVIPLTFTMVFVGLLQGIGMWSLASRWTWTTLVYGICGLAYWLALLGWGTSLAALLKVMPVVAGIAFVMLFCVWILALRRQPAAE